jgi:hypothetical protein
MSAGLFCVHPNLAALSDTGGGLTGSYQFQKDPNNPNIGKQWLEQVGKPLIDNAFGGKNYLSFMTVDKGSGVDHYAVAETRLPSFLLALFPLSWETATSPYLLADQNLTSTVYVQAVDRIGNEQLSVFHRTHLFTTYELVFLGILIGVVFLSIYKRRRGRRPETNP